MEVEVNAGWGDTLVVIIQIKGGLERRGEPRPVGVFRIFKVVRGPLSQFLVPSFLFWIAFPGRVGIPHRNDQDVLHQDRVRVEHQSPVWLARPLQRLIWWSG